MDKRTEPAQTPKAEKRETIDLWREVRDRLAVIKALSQVDDRDPPSRVEN